MVSGPRSLPWTLVPCPFSGVGSTLVLSLVLPKVLSKVPPGGGDYPSPGQGCIPVVHDRIKLTG